MPASPWYDLAHYNVSGLGFRSQQGSCADYANRMLSESEAEALPEVNPCLLHPQAVGV